MSNTISLYQTQAQPWVRLNFIFSLHIAIEPEDYFPIPSSGAILRARLDFQDLALLFFAFL